MLVKEGHADRWQECTGRSRKTLPYSYKARMIYCNLDQNDKLVLSAALEFKSQQSKQTIFPSCGTGVQVRALGQVGLR